jgi:TolA-binding protein
MKNIIIILFIVLTSMPLIALQSRDIDDIIQSIAEPESGNRSEKPAIQNNDTGTKKEKTKASSFPAPDEALLKSGIDLYEAALYTSARQKFEELRIKYPESPFKDVASIWLSRIHVQLNNFNDAVKVLNSINQESGEYPTAMYNIAEINLKKGDDTGAIENFYKVATLFPDNELADDALIHIARLYLKSNKGNQALEAAIKVIKNYEDRETIDDAYFIMAQVYEKDALLKDFGLARKMYKIFIKKAEVEKAPYFYNSPLLETVKNNLSRIENTYYSRGFNN